MFSFEFYEISKNTFFTEHLRVTAFRTLSLFSKTRQNIEILSDEI